MRQPKLTHPKTQTPIAAKQIETEWDKNPTYCNGEFASLTNIDHYSMCKKRNYPLKKKNTPYSVYSICLAYSV